MIYYTTSGADPRAVGNGVQGSAYTGPIPVGVPFTVKARVRSTGGVWSPLMEGSFAPPAQRIVITELHYNPSVSDNLTAGFWNSRM